MNRGRACKPTAERLVDRLLERQTALSLQRLEARNDVGVDG
jgi:hypothetical protein